MKRCYIDLFFVPAFKLGESIKDHVRVEFESENPTFFNILEEINNKYGITLDKLLFRTVMKNGTVIGTISKEGFKPLQNNTDITLSNGDKLVLLLSLVSGG